MLPKTGAILTQDFAIEPRPSKTFCIADSRFNGYTDGREAVEQAIGCILNTERYEWIIYGWNYGAEFKDLLSKPKGLIKSKVKKRIRDALMQDDRIQGVDSFTFLEAGGKLQVSFVVHTQYGEVAASKEVER